MTPKERAVRLLALRVAQAWLAKEEKELRSALNAELTTGERVAAALDPANPDDTLLGFVQRKAGAKSIRVTDRPALIEWARVHAPDELQTVTTTDLRSSFVASVSAAVKSDGGWHDPATGEFVDVPGVELVQGDPTLAVSVTAEADALVADALASRTLELGPGVA